MTTDSSDRCGFVGNPDLYGLGIRLGVYFQWLSVFVISYWYPGASMELAEDYTIFLTAVSIAALVITAEADSTYAVEVLILIYIVFGGFFTVLAMVPRTKYLNTKFTQEAIGRKLMGGVQFTILSGGCLYCSWFWLRGLHHNFKETPCGTYGFLFARVSLYNPAVFRFFAALSIILSCIYVPGTLFVPVQFLMALYSLGPLRKMIDKLFPNLRRHATNMNNWISGGINNLAGSTRPRDIGKLKREKESGLPNVLY
jgi:hypothetical protein